MTFAPEGAYGQTGGANVFTHGVELGVARNETHDLQTATGELVQSLAQGNPRMGRPAGYRRATVANRRGLTTTMANVSEATGRPETIQIFSTLMPDGNLLYVIAVAPSDQFGSYQDVFQRVAESIQITPR